MYQHFITLGGHYMFIDDPIILIDHLGYEFRGHLAGLDENEFPLIWKSGCTSWTVEDHPKKHFISSGGWYGYRFYDDPRVTLNISNSCKHI